MTRSARATSLVALTVLLGLLAGCAGGSGAANPSASETAQPVAGGDLVVGQTDIPPCLDSAITPYFNHPGRQLTDNLFDQNLETGEIEPWLATGYEVSDDGLSYTISLRDDVTFSNGEPFNAEAVKANFDTAIEFKKTDGRGVAPAYLTGYTGSEVVDDQTIVVNFAKPKASFLQGLTEKALGIAWPGSIVGKDYDTRCTQGVIGTGPFVLEENVPDDHITIVKRAGYAWASPNSANKGEAYLDSITFVEIPETGVLADSLLSGEIDAAISFASTDIDRIKADGFQFFSAVSAGVPDTLYPNLGVAPFNDLAVRQAVQIGIDREEIKAAVYNEFSPAATSAVSTPVPGWVDLADGLAYDLDAATAILDKDGWTEGADGIREKDGQKLTATALFTLENDRVFYQLLQSQLKKLGFDLELKQVTTAEQTEALSNGDWGLIRGNFTRADPDVLLNTYHPSYAYSKPPADAVADLAALLDAQTVELDWTKRQAIVAQALGLIIDKGYGFPLVESGRPIAASPSTHGFTYNLPGWNLFNEVWKDPAS